MLTGLIPGVTVVHSVGFSGLLIEAVYNRDQKPIWFHDERESSKFEEGLNSKVKLSPLVK